MNGFSIGYFLIVTLATGTLVDLLVKDWQADWLEKLVMRLGVGLAALSVIGVILNLCHLPLDYRVFLAVGLLIGCGALYRNRAALAGAPGRLSGGVTRCCRSRSFWYGALMLVLFAVTLQMYLGGSFAYSYFEDTDPWGYAAVADYIGENRTFTTPYYGLHYSEPYTQGYQIVMGVLSQTNPSLYWTLKFFNALVNAFGVLFVYYAARRLSGDEEVALLSGLFLFAVPAWVSHFVFSLHYNMTLFVVLLYVLAQLMREARSRETADEAGAGAGWLWVGAVIYASLLVNHFSTVFHASIFCALFIVTRVLAERRVDWPTLQAFFFGGLLALAFYIPAYARHWWIIGTDEQLGGIRTLFPLLRLLVTPAGLAVAGGALVGVVLLYRVRQAWQPPLESWLAVGNRGMFLWLGGLGLGLVLLLLPVEILRSFGTGDRDYHFADFFTASSDNLMNNPIGLGPVLTIAVLVGGLWVATRLPRFFRPAESWVAAALAWLIAAVLLVLGKYLSVAISPFRVWTFLGLFASLFAAAALVAMAKGLSHRRWLPLTVVALLGVLLVPTTFVPKYRLNTMPWQDHTIGVPQSHELFVWMREGGIPKNSVVAHLCGNSEFLSGYDMNPPLWNEAFHPRRDREPYFVARPLELTADAWSVLKGAGVEYVTLGASCLWQAPVPAEQEEAYGYYLRRKMDEYLADPRLSPVKNTGLELLLKLN